MYRQQNVLKNRRTTVSMSYDEKKKRKEFEDEMMIVILSRVPDVNSFEKR